MRSDSETFFTPTYSADIQRYIVPNLSYLHGINGKSLESLVRRVEEISRLRRHLSSPRLVVSVGVGEGEELHAIYMLYSDCVQRIIGIDLSQLALETSRERVIGNNLPVELILGNATNLPLQEESVDGVILSSILHEVYSYAPDGKGAWNKTIQEGVRAIREEGCIFIRDSAVPNLRGDVRVQLKTNLAREFYEYFTSEYRFFNGWDNLRGKFSSNLPQFPIDIGLDPITLSVGQAAELFFHFVNFQMGYPDEDRILNRNQKWKELNETYYIPRDPSSPEPMSMEEYVAEVITIGNSALSGKGSNIICTEMDYSIRLRMYEPLLKHFSVGLAPDSGFSPEGSDMLLKHFINKMELVFKKVKKEEIAVE